MAPGPAVRRRALLAGTAATAAATSGCIGELRNLLGRQRTQQITLTIVSLPGSFDPYAVRIANELAANLEQAGVAATVDIMSPDVLFRDVLINHDFDIYVARYPSEGEPDEYRSLLHSRYGEEAGWQNPFGFSFLNIDELLETQRVQSGDARVDTVRELQSAVVREQPFTVVAYPDRIGGVRHDRWTGWSAGGPHELDDFIGLERVSDADDVRLVVRDERITRNRNPIAVEHRDRGDVTDLLYEPLVRELGSGTDRTPWLARSVEWIDDDGLIAAVRLRETPWHDGEPVTVGDVAFTYEFLKDTSLGSFDSPEPTPWRRARISVVDTVDILSDDRLRIEFDEASREVAQRALTVPILPEHIWSERTNPAADIGPLELGGQTTEALVWPNEAAIGSGPVQFVEATADEFVALETFDEHFLYAGETTGIPDVYLDGLPFQGMRFEVAPSNEAAVELLETGEVDGSGDNLQAFVTSRLARHEDVTLTVRRTNTIYHVGYNCRNAPLSDPRFRRMLARMIDREYMVTTAFGGAAVPSETMLQSPWIPADLDWTGDATLPFLGDSGDLNVPAARDAFREAGYNYDNEQLVSRGDS